MVTWMDDQQLDRNLQSIGKECFVTYFTEFWELTRSNEHVAAQMEEERGYTQKSCRSRTSHARSIIKAGRAEDALNRCSTNRLPAHVRERASALVDWLRSRP